MPCPDRDIFLQKLREREGGEEMSENIIDEFQMEGEAWAELRQKVNDLNGELEQLEDWFTEHDVDEMPIGVEEELSEHEKEEYSSDEKRVASHMSSYSEMTKSECLSLVDMANPERQTDVLGLMGVIEKLLDDEEYEALYTEMKAKYDEKSMKEEDSILNNILR